MYLQYLLPQLSFLYDMSEMNKEKIELAKKKYWDAVNLPRKKKKKARKIALNDYNFWIWVDKTLSVDFNF